MAYKIIVEVECDRDDDDDSPVEALRELLVNVAESVAGYMVDNVQVFSRVDPDAELEN